MARRDVETHCPDLDLISSYRDGFCSCLVIAEACDLRLFDELYQSPDGVTASDLALKKCWNEGNTERLLNTCVALKLVHKVTGPDGDVYSLAGPGKYLRHNTEEITVAPDYKMFLHKIYKSLSFLGQEVQTGANKASDVPIQVTLHKAVPDAPPVAQHGHGHDNGHSHDHGHSHGHGHGHSHGHGHHHGHGHGHAGRSPEEMLAKLRGMGSMMQPYTRDLVTAFDLSGYKSVVDLGGGSGALTFELCRTYPSMQVIYFDVPPVTEVVQKHLLPSDVTNLKFVAGDFFEVDLPQADLFVLSKIVHDWKPDQVDTLLNKVYNSTNPGGGIILQEKVMSDSKDGPVSAHLWDVLVMSMCAGQQRSGDEYKQLLEGAGYHDVQVGVTNPNCMYDVIYAKKP